MSLETPRPGEPDPTEVAATTQPRRSLWRHSDFMKLWTGQTISQFGDEITLLALPFVAILTLGAEALEMGILGVVRFLPWIAFTLPAGVWVDRMRRRPILIGADLARALVLASIPIAFFAGWLTMVQVYIVAFLAGTLEVFFDVAYQSYLPSLVERGQLTEGNAKLEISRSGAQLAGPGIAGGLVEVLTAPVAIAVDAVSYLGSALFVSRIRRPEPDVPAPPAEDRPRMRSQIMEGLRYVLGHPLLRPIAACTALSNLFSAMATAILILFAVRELGLTAGAIGVALAIGNVGFLVGAFAAERIAGRVGIGRAIVGSSVLFGLAGFAYPLATSATAVVLLVAGGLLFGFGGVVYNVNQVSLRQAITPGRMQGRMNATMRFVVWGTLPIGALAGGALGGAIGLRPTLWIAAAGGFLAFVPPLFSPVRSLVSIPEGEEEEAALPEDEARRAEADAGGPPEPAPSDQSGS
jgi:MFS family permease